MRYDNLSVKREQNFDPLQTNKIVDGTGIGDDNHRA